MNFKQYLKNIFRSILNKPIRLTAVKAIIFCSKKISDRIIRHRDAKEQTFYRLIPEGNLHSYFRAIPIALLESQQEWLAQVAGKYLEHRFDLLGSGWIQVRHGMKCRGLEGYRYPSGMGIEPDRQGDWLNGRINPANLGESQRLWAMVAPNYQPVDWQLDFKSGYRWSERTWYGDIKFGQLPGVDVKVPWELARMQHLPQMAWAHALAQAGKKGFKPAGEYLQEFQNQILDFMAANPPRFGVNWRCTMDVAIRAANWLTAFDLFKIYGARFEPTFEPLFKRSLYEHGLHIIGNLEWQPDWRGNHYLANITGLLFLAAYLPRSPQVDAWLAFAVQELVREAEYQFHGDGTNFESSTSYHCLAAEMLVYATALVLGLPETKRSALETYDHRLLQVRPRLKPAAIPYYPLPGSDLDSPFPGWYWEKLEKMAEFAMHLAKPDGHIPQIGDNDSGRFLKLQPVYHLLSVGEAKKRYLNLAGYEDLPEAALYPDEDHLDHRHLVVAANHLFRREDFAAHTGHDWLETELLRQVTGNLAIPSYRGRKGFSETGGLESTVSCLKGVQEFKGAPAEIAADRKNKGESLSLLAYPDFGLYIYRSDKFYLAIRCATGRPGSHGAHAHYDQLSLELSANGKDFIIDPGTYVYTPLPGKRNLFRSAAWHNAPYMEPAEEKIGETEINDLFSFRPPGTAEIACCAKELFKAVLKNTNERYALSRTILFSDNEIRILDESSPGGNLQAILNMAPGVEIQELKDESALGLINDGTRLRVSAGPGKLSLQAGVFSGGYGRRQTSLRVQLQGGSNQLSWQIKFKDN